MPRTPVSRSPSARTKPYSGSKQAANSALDTSTVPRTESETSSPSEASATSEFEEKPTIESDDDDGYQNVSKRTGKGKTKEKSKGKAQGAAKNQTTTPKNTARGKAGKWTPEEDWILFQHLHPKADKPNWSDIAGAVGGGRDGKSCINRYYAWTHQGKLESAIKRIGEL